MDPIVVVLIALGLLGLALLFVPVRLNLSAQARGDPSGAWALAGAGKLGPLVTSAVAAHGVPGRVELSLLGRAIWRFPRAARRDEPRSLRERTEKAAQRAERRYRRLERFFDPLELFLFVLRERRRLRVERCELEADYSFADVATTGKLMAALYALDGMLPPPFVLRQRVSWESVDRAKLAFSGRIKLWPGLLLVESGLFVIRSIRIRKRRPAQSGASK